MVLGRAKNHTVMGKVKNSKRGIDRISANPGGAGRVPSPA